MLEPILAISITFVGYRIIQGIKQNIKAKRKQHCLRRARLQYILDEIVDNI